MTQAVLIVDDSPEIHSLVDVRLRQQDLDFHHAYDTQEGFTIANAVLPDLILLDVVMPRESGFDLCQRLKANPRTANIPVIFLTGTSDTLNKVQGFDLGAVDYVVKPFDAVELNARVRAALRVKRYQDMLARHAMIDGLTGLWNRACFDQRLEEELAAAKRYERDFSLVLLDLDHFKPLNDNYGHPFGDHVLQKVGELLTSMARQSDTACRYGGEEFGVILRETACPDAVIVAERMAVQISSLEFFQGDQRVTVSASIGVASFVCLPNDAEQSSKRLLAAADHCLYRAKSAGRNRVCSAAGPVGV